MIWVDLPWYMICHGSWVMIWFMFMSHVKFLIKHQLHQPDVSQHRKGHLRFCIFWTKEWPNTEASESYLGSSFWNPKSSLSHFGPWTKKSLNFIFPPIKINKYIIPKSFVRFGLAGVFLPPPPSTPHGRLKSPATLDLSICWHCIWQHLVGSTRCVVDRGTRGEVLI